MNRVRRSLRIAEAVFAGLGLVVLTLAGVGLVLDYRAIDRTEGAYEPPYEDYTGEPIDWSRLDTTADGMVYRGHVVDIMMNCRSGMISFEIYRIRMQWRRLSPRALAIHQPRRACLQRGFEPRF